MRKRVLAVGVALSLALTATPALAGVQAATFTDAAQIGRWEPVRDLAWMGVIAGKDSGAFDPAAPVTRAEMAKMLCMMDRGGKGDLVGAEAKAAPFTDTRGHWAEKYIAYCAERGLVNGRDDGTFDPAGTVNGAEAAQMLLFLLGYNEDIFLELTGTDWKGATSKMAEQEKLYTGLKDFDIATPLSRDAAAQMLYNAMNAKGMEAREQAQENGEITTTYRESEQTFLQRVWGMDRVDAPAPEQPK